tara:strand:- start:8094 stop:8408 length:315 start_codon:yes stop_codon:yes gene_type:complete
MPRKSTKLSIAKLQEGITMFNGVSATLEVVFGDYFNQFSVVNFITKYEDELGISLIEDDTYTEQFDGWLLHCEASSRKEITRICGIIEEDIDIEECNVVRVSNN